MRVVLIDEEIVAAEALKAGLSRNSIACDTVDYELDDLVEAAAQGCEAVVITVPHSKIDVIRFIDWLRAQMQERVALLIIANGGKLPYTDASVGLVKGELRAVLNEGIRRGGLSPDVPATIIAPKVADVSTADRNARRLPDVTFNARLAGAIHKVLISGTVSA